MHQQLFRHGSFGLELLLLGCFSVAFAQDPAQTPAQAPQPLFRRMGVIGNLDLSAGSITVNDFRYQLPPNVRVYVYDRTIKAPQTLRADARLQDGRALRAGMRIGYIVAGEAGGKRGTLTEAWILPPGRMPELEKGIKNTGSLGSNDTDKSRPVR